jgi:hypothetical protein
MLFQQELVPPGRRLHTAKPIEQSDRGRLGGGGVENEEAMRVN